MNKFIMLVGIPASGKTTLANLLKENSSNTIVLSSDNIRKELFGNEEFQDKNGEVFEEMSRRAKTYLKEGKDVVFDATNANSRRRKGILQQLPKDIEKECIYLSSDPSTSYSNQKNRERQVSISILDRMYKSMQIPMYYEGWDKIKMLRSHAQEEMFNMPESYEEYCRLLRRMGQECCIDAPQDNPYHTLSVSKHMFYTYDSVKDSDNIRLKIASLLHDIGKPYCKVDNGKYSSFKFHENVSAQRAILVLEKCGLTNEDIIYVVTLIQLHMRLNAKEWGSKAKTKFINEIGEELYNDLLQLNNADKSAK